MKLPIPTEHQIQTDIVQYLRIKGYYVMRLNSGKISVGEGRARRMIQLSEVGTPDLMAFKTIPGAALYEKASQSWKLGKYVDLLFIEVKRPGNKPTINQEHKMRELESFGARCLVAHSVEEVEKVL